MTINRLLFWLKTSRPGLWFPTLWLYLLPTSQLQIWDSWAFWVGLLFVTFPLNFLVYGWNDIVDTETDALNPRKDSFLFGARGSQHELQSLPRAIFIVQLLCWPIFIWLAGWKILLVLVGLLLVLWAYNHPTKGLRGKPPLELTCQIGYLLVVPFSIWINQTPAVHWVTFLYLSLFAVQSHLIGEVMDIVPDKTAGRRTTANVLGMRNTKLLIILIIALEASLVIGFYGDYIFGGMLGLGLVWLLIDLLVIFKTEQYSLTQMKLFGIMSNLIALASMIYVWYSGCLNIG